MRARKTPDLARMLAVYSGQQVCGYFRHGADGVEVYDATGAPIGVYANQSLAAAALASRDAS